jgi:hypothetical protein
MTQISAPLQAIQTNPLFLLELDVTAVQRIAGDIIVGVIGGGRFEGTRLRGRVLEGGSDWQRVMPDGTVVLDCRIVLETDAGELIAMTYQGVRSGSAEVLARLAKGEKVGADEYYLRIAPLFRTQSPKLDWLNKLQAVGAGQRLPKGPIYNVFEVL